MNLVCSGREGGVSVSGIVLEMREDGNLALVRYTIPAVLILRTEMIPNLGVRGVDIVVMAVGLV